MVDLSSNMFGFSLCSTTQMFVTAHQSVEATSRNMWQTLKRRNYVTPTNYLETVRNYKALLAEKRAELLSKSDKLKGGLTKLDETRVQVCQVVECNRCCVAARSSVLQFAQTRLLAACHPI